jgi:hypothetical protein
MSAGLLSGLGIGCSAAVTVAIDERTSVSAARRLMVLIVGFIILVLTDD